MNKKFIIFIFILIFTAVNSGNFALSATNAGQDSAEIKAINQQIEAKKKEVEKIASQQKAYSDAVKKAQSQKASLANQISIIENKVAKTELEITGTELEISQADLEIKKNNIQIIEQEDKISQSKDHIADIISLIHKNDQKGYLEAFFLNESFSDFLAQFKYFSDINEKLKQEADGLEEGKKTLEKEKEDLIAKENKLKELKKNLLDKQEILADEKESKTIVLDQTRQNEGKYQKLLAAAKAEQEQAAREIASLEKTAREKLSALEGKKLQFNDTGFIWPVPSQIVVCEFHDPEYPFRYIFEHPALDIRAAQGTPVRAAASGYVATAKNAGMGYSYVMLIHGNSLSTVYGHLSKIYVSTDEYVVQGQVIGLSGGMPGTPGAGNLTTGPHLHFETRLNGLPVNARKYLP